MVAYVRNPATLVMQRRLFAPGYEGPGKWILFDAATRRSFLAIRRPEDFATGALPRVLRMLLGLPCEKIDESTRDQLVEAGLLVPADSTVVSGSALLDLFQMSVFDYPFLDYSTSEAFAVDGCRMARYADLSPMPPGWTERRGPTFALPPVRWSDVTPAEPGAEFGLKELAAVLRFTFGGIGVLGTGRNQHIRKTSPSGGAKHPTEGWVHLSVPWAGLDAGSYAYDGEAHRLVADLDPYESQGEPAEGLLSVSVRSRVERAMWRYRDARSSRAVLIDAGHIVETLIALLSVYGVKPAIHSYPRAAESSSDWLREPEVARVTLERAGVDGVSPVASHSRIPATRRTPDTSLLTNPAMYFTPQSGGFTAYAVHPAVRATEIDAVDFQILTHCIRSHRGESSRPGDRLMTAEALRQEFAPHSEERVARLVNCGALLEGEAATGLYGEARRWAEGGWYLPFLTWLEATNTATSSSVLPKAARCARPPVPGGDVSFALRERVTTRSFSTRALTEAHLMQLLEPITALSDEPPQMDVYVAGLVIDGLERGGLYSYDLASRTLVPLNRTISPADLAAIAIGQPWVHDSAVAVWIAVRPRRPSEFFPSHLLLGRAAQRMCLRAARDGVGVFQTPAVRDLLWCAALGLAPDPARVLYAVCLGWPSTSARRR